MMWTPLSVSMMSLRRPTVSANDASSKGFCICPLPKVPSKTDSVQDKRLERYNHEELQSEAGTNTCFSCKQEEELTRRSDHKLSR
jgi:hypothetical protein